MTEFEQSIVLILVVRFKDDFLYDEIICYNYIDRVIIFLTFPVGEHTFMFCNAYRSIHFSSANR